MDAIATRRPSARPPRRRPGLRTQLLAVLAVIATLVALTLVGGGGGDSAGPTPTIATTTTQRGFPPAGEGSVCHLLGDEEAGALVGHPLAHPPIEPQTGQCAWPREEGTPLDAELFFVVKEQQGPDLRAVLEGTWDPGRFDLEPVDGPGDQAFFVVGRGDPEVVGLEVYALGLHVVLGNGGVPGWEGTPDEVRARLRQTMEALLARAAERLGTG